MAEVKKHPRLRRIARVLGYSASTVFALALLLQFILWGGFHWLNGTGGQSWLLRQLDGALAGSGYTAKMQGLHMSVFGTLSADEWQLGDSAGTIAEGRDLRLHVSLAAALNKTLALKLNAASAHLLRLPAASDAPAPPAGPFALPDFYFRRIAMKSFHIDALTMDEAIAGRVQKLTPDLQGDVSVTATGASFNLTGSIAAVDKADSLALFLPQKIAAKGKFDSASQQALLDELVLDAPAYSVTGKGAAGLSPDAAVSLSADIRNADLAAVTGAEVAGSAVATLELSGTAAAPLAKITGGVKQLVIRGQNYPDMTINAAVRDLLAAPKGNFVVESDEARLGGDFAFGNSHITLKKIQGSAPEAKISADIDYDTKAGLASGAADVTANLSAYQNLLGIKIDGRAKATIGLSAKDGRQAGVVDAHLSDISYEHLHLATGEARVSLADVWQYWPDDIRVKLQGLNAGEIGFPTLNLALGKAEGESYRLSTDGAADYNGRIKFDGTANVSGTNWNEATAKNIVLTLKPVKGTAVLTGEASARGADVALTLKSVSLAQLPSGFAKAVTSGAVTLKGTFAAPEIVAKTRSSFANPALNLDVQSNYRGGRLALEAEGRGKGIEDLSATVTAPMELSLAPWKLVLPENKGLDGKISLRSDAGALSPLFLDAGQSLQGRINAQLALGGGLANPAITGPVSLAGGTFTARNLGVALQNISLKAVLNRDAITLTSATATDGRKGSLKASGTAARSGGAAKIDIAVHHMDISRFNENVAGSLSAALNLTGSGSGYVLKGKITPDDLAITIPERFRSDIPKLNIVKRYGKKSPVVAAKANSLALDILVDASERVMVRGWGLDAEFGGKLDIGGTAAAPQVHGTLQSRRGRYEEFGKRFTISRAILQFNGPVPPSPYLDVLAETKADDITGQVTLTGPVSKPVIAFSSVPALPQDEVLSRILFGKGMEKISPFQAIQLARTLQRFSGKGGGPDPLGALRGATGLDDIDVENDAEGGTSVGAGKYITDKVYLQVGSGTGKKSGAAKVQVELTPKVKLESKIGQDSQAGAGITWGWDY